VSSGYDDLAAAIRGLDLPAAERVVRSRGLGEAVLTELLDLAGRALQAEPALAVLTLDLADRLAPEVCADEVEPRTSYLRARLAVNGGRPDEALALIARSRACWLALGRPLEAHRTELGRMHVLDDLGRHQEAAEAALSLLAVLAEHDRTGLADVEREQLRWLEAAASENLGVAYGLTGHHEEALEAYRQAEHRYRLVGGDDDLARCRANRGVELVAIGRAVEGFEVLLSAAEGFAEAGNRVSQAQCLGHVAEAELLLGRYAASLERFQQAGRLLDELDATTEAHRLRLRTVRAYLALNLADEAMVLADRVERALTGVGLEHDVAEARWLGGVASLRVGHPEHGLALLRQAVDGADRVGDPALRARALVATSEALMTLDRRADALSAAEGALATVESGRWPIEEFHVRLRLAQLLADREPAEAHLDGAQALADQLGLPHLRYPLLVERGRRQRRRGDLLHARQSLEEAIEVVESLRGPIPAEMVRTSYLEGRTAAHVELISMLVDGDPVDRAVAFDLAEASRSRTLNDLVAGSISRGLPAGSASDPTLARYEADLDAAYSALTLGSADQTRSQRQAIRERVVELERAIRLAQVEAESSRRAPTADGRRLAPHPRADEQVVEYHVVGRRIVVFVWCGGDLEVVTASADADQVVELLGSWERSRQRYEVARSLGSGRDRRLVAAAEDILRRLWSALLSSVAPHLAPDGGDLLVVPHGMLHAVPFHALMGPDGPVGHRWTVTVAPSYAVAAQLQANPWAHRTGRALVIGVPDEAAPAVADEARSVAAALPGAELLLGGSATSENLVAGLSRPVDVLHLACHGIHRALNPMFSALKLSDRWLTAREVATLSVPGALVVLSACESGRQSADRHREETIGLARSFVAAGASGVIVSQWLANDRVTAELMTRFYRELGGRPPGAALRAAQISVAVDHPHPADWAPFVIHGGAAGGHLDPPSSPTGSNSTEQNSTEQKQRGVT
jgi:CHAT domain-containing protein